MIEKYERLKTVLDSDSFSILESMYYDYKAALETCKESKKTSDLKQYSKCKNDLEHTINEFWEIHFPEDEHFKNISEVYEYLRDMGYRIAKRTVYQHKEEGKLTYDPNSGITIDDVDRYAERYLSAPEKEASLNDKKTKADLELKEIRLEKERLFVEEKNGKLIPRETVGAEFAARIEEIKRGFEEIEATLPVVLSGLPPEEIKKTLRRKFDSMLSNYSRKLETLK